LKEEDVCYCQQQWLPGGLPERDSLGNLICRKNGNVLGMRPCLGAVGASVSGRLLTRKKRSGPPVFHVIHALNEVASMIDQEGRVSPKALKQLEKPPIPMMPFALWRRMFMLFAALG